MYPKVQKKIGTLTGRLIPERGMHAQYCTSSHFLVLKFTDSVPKAVFCTKSLEFVAVSEQQQWPELMALVFYCII